MKPTTVLIPIDGSDFSAEILPRITQIVSPLSTQLVLFQVLERPYFHSPAPSRMVTGEASSSFFRTEKEYFADKLPIYASQEIDALVASARRQMAVYARILRDKGYAVEVEVQLGEPATEIQRYAESTTVDLIAMTTHGRTGIERLLTGSVAEQVMRSVSMPVMLFRPFRAAQAEETS